MAIDAADRKAASVGGLFHHGAASKRNASAITKISPTTAATAPAVILALSLEV
jgi:hypothetical protein